MKRFNIYVIFAGAAFFLGSLFTLAYCGANNGLDQLKVLVDVMTQVQQNFVEEPDQNALLEGALEGMVGGLDEFSQYITADGMKIMSEETKGEFGGVGMRLLSDNKGEVIVTTPMLNTPAYKAGVEPGDKLITIDGKKVEDMTSDEAVAALRGKAGTSVKITVQRKDAAGKISTKNFTLKRAQIVPEVIFSKMLPNDIGYIYVTDFSGHTMRDFESAIKTLTKQNMKALIIDLRFNPGGLLDGAIDMVKLFVGESKLIVYTKGRKEDYFKEYHANAIAKYPDLPLVVLVNEASASGSEIVAGALQDYKRAVIVGARTFGKGSVQQVTSLPNGGGLRLTVAKYYTPLGRMIHKNFKAKKPDLTGGIMPDFEVPFELAKNRQATYFATNLIYSPSKKTAAPEAQKDPVEDIVLKQAAELLKAREALGNLNK